MHVDRLVKKLVALSLAVTAVAAAPQASAQAVGVRAPDAVSGVASSGTSFGIACAARSEPGYSHAVPPILPPVLCSEVAAIKLPEALEVQAFHYATPATARYSDAEMNAYASERKH